MMGPMTDLEVVRALYEAMAARDLERLLPLIDPGYTITQDAALPWGGRYVGHDGFALALSGAIDSAVAIEAIFEAGGEVFQYGRTRSTVSATGNTFDLPEVHRWTIRDGRAVEAHFAIDTPAMLRALEPG